MIIVILKELKRRLNFNFEKLWLNYNFQKAILNDIIEHGISDFCQKVVSPENSKNLYERILLVTSQFVSFRDFSERLNLLISEISRMNKIENENKLMKFIFKHCKKIFSSEIVHLWLVDNVLIIEFLNFYLLNNN